MKWIATGLMVGAVACGGSDGSGSGATGNGSSVTGASSLAGSWTGDWKSNSGVGGAVTMTLTQDGDAIAGTVSMTGSVCLETAKVTGTVNGDDVNVDVVAGDNHASAHMTITGPGQLDGTYTALQAGICTGDTGMISATR